MNKNLNGTVTIDRLQMLIEHDKAALAREIHDDLGGYLIASAMDITTLRRRFSSHDSDSLHKFDRLARMLNDAIDFTRRITEDLHPTLLDNVGLFAALRWHIKHLCCRSSLTCTQHLPDQEPDLSPSIAIVLYRMGQEALTVAENQIDVTHIEFTMALDAGILTLEVVADGASTAPLEHSRGHVALDFLRHRLRSLGGALEVGHPHQQGLRLSGQVRVADEHAAPAP